MKCDNGKDTVLASYELFNLIPLWTVLVNNSAKIYKFLGIPVWTVCTIIDEEKETCRKRYYLLGILLIEKQIETKDDDKETDFEDLEEELTAFF